MKFVSLIFISLTLVHLTTCASITEAYDTSFWLIYLIHISQKQKKMVLINQLLRTTTMKWLGLDSMSDPQSSRLQTRVTHSLEFVTTGSPQFP